MQALTNKASSLVYTHREKDRDLTFLVFLHSFFADLYFYQVYKYFSLSSIKTLSSSLLVLRCFVVSETIIKNEDNMVRL